MVFAATGAEPISAVVAAESPGEGWAMNGAGIDCCPAGSSDEGGGFLRFAGGNHPAFFISVPAGPHGFQRVLDWVGVASDFDEGGGGFGVGGVHFVIRLPDDATPCGLRKCLFRYFTPTCGGMKNTRFRR